MKTNSVKALSDTLRSSVKKIDSDEIAKKLAGSFSGIKEKISKNGSEKILNALDGLSAQGKSQITFPSVKKIDSDEIAKKLAGSFSGIEEKISKNGSRKILDIIDGVPVKDMSSGKKAAGTFLKKLGK